MPHRGPSCCSPHRNCFWFSRRPQFHQGSRKTHLPKTSRPHLWQSFHSCSRVCCRHQTIRQSKQTRQILHRQIHPWANHAHSAQKPRIFSPLFRPFQYRWHSHPQISSLCQPPPRNWSAFPHLSQSSWRRPCPQLQRCHLHPPQSRRCRYCHFV